MTITTDMSAAEEQARRLEQVAEQVVALCTDPRFATQLATPTGADSWSAVQIVGHMVEMIPYWLHHCHTLIQASEPPLFGRSPDAPERLAGVARGDATDPQTLVELIRTEVQHAADRIRQMTAEERNKQGHNIQRGTMRVADVVEHMIVAHAEAHLAQLRAALEVVG